MEYSPETYAIVTPLSKNLYAVMNGILHLYRLKGCPEKITLVAPLENWVGNYVKAVEKAVHKLCPETSIEKVKSPHSIPRLAGRFAAEVKELKRNGLKVYVNITPGTKVMSIAAYEGALSGEADEIFYLGIEDASYSSTLLPFIPSPIISYHSPRRPGEKR